MEIHPHTLCLRYLLTLGGFTLHPQLTAPLLPAGEGGLEVRGHGDRPHLPLDVHHRLLAGNRGALSPTLPGRDDLGIKGDVGTSHSIMTVEDPWVGCAAVGREAKGMLGMHCSLLSCSWWWPSWPQGKLCTVSPPTKHGMEASRRGIHFLQLLQVPSGTQGTRLVVTSRGYDSCFWMHPASGPRPSQHGAGHSALGRGRGLCSDCTAQGLCSALQSPIAQAITMHWPTCVLVGLSAQGSWANRPLHPIPVTTSRPQSPSL